MDLTAVRLEYIGCTNGVAIVQELLKALDFIFILLYSSLQLIYKFQECLHSGISHGYLCSIGDPFTDSVCLKGRNWLWKVVALATWAIHNLLLLLGEVGGGSYVLYWDMQRLLVWLCSV